MAIGGGVNPWLYQSKSANRVKRWKLIFVGLVESKPKDPHVVSRGSTLSGHIRGLRGWMLGPVTLGPLVEFGIQSVLLKGDNNTVPLDLIRAAYMEPHSECWDQLTSVCPFLVVL